MFIVTKVFLTGEQVPNGQGRLIDGTIIREKHCKNSVEVEDLKGHWGTDVQVQYVQEQVVVAQRQPW